MTHADDSGTVASAGMPLRLVRSSAALWVWALMGMAVLIALGMDAGGGVITPIPLPITPVAAEPAALTAEPAYRRIEVAAGAQTDFVVTLHARRPTQLLGAEADCHCVSLVNTLPLALPVGDTSLAVHVVGVQPGIKTLTLRTARGSVAVTIQVVTPGLGEGAALAAEALRHAQAEGLSLTVLVHDLHGITRNCGCSGGSLGGVDHLAALRRVLPGARLVLTGEIDGDVPRLGIALATHGWELQPADIPVSAEAATMVGKPGLFAVVAVGDQHLVNQRVVRPLLDGGAIAHLLFSDARGTVVEQRLLPIDQTLPADAAVFAGLPTPRMAQLAHTPQFSGKAPLSIPAVESCTSCHAAAQHVWQNSAHAHAWASLSQTDRKDGSCVECHSSPATATVAAVLGPGANPQQITARERVPDVGCIGCHQEADAHAHADKPAKVPAGAVVDCKLCHDARHHPGFDRASAWLRIMH